VTVAVPRNTIRRTPYAKTRVVSDRELGLPLIMFKSNAGKQSLFTVMVIGNAKICTVRADCRVFSVNVAVKVQSIVPHTVMEVKMNVPNRSG